jgi:hypothetical protein
MVLVSYTEGGIQSSIFELEKKNWTADCNPVITIIVVYKKGMASVLR